MWWVALVCMENAEARSSKGVYSKSVNLLTYMFAL